GRRICPPMVHARLPTEREGVQISPGQSLVALTASCTDQITLQQVEILPEEILAGPIENVMALNSGGGTGGLQTSALAVGLTLAAVDFIRQQAEQRNDLLPVAEKLGSDTQALRHALTELTAGRPSITPGELRQRANSLVLRATQAALSAAKGAGFVSGHVAGRMAREALFFLVWSCPQPVVRANLCELAQLQ
ncbi:MAG: acyl-CoA dehydrogenase, partial [Aureliella sp.]